MTTEPAAATTSREFPHLFSPLRVGPRTFRNRIYSPPHAPGYQDGSRLIPDRLLNYWEAKARGGVAAVSTGVTPVHPSTGALRVAFEDPSFVDEYGRAAEAMHRHGALFVVQPWHGGTQAGGVGGRAAWAPSAVVTPTGHNVPHVMTEGEIQDIVHRFGVAGEKIAESGADGIEIHGAHGYLITEFTSGFFNQRDDQYGGDEERRTRFVKEIVAAVRQGAGDRVMVGMRFSADEFVDGGLTVEQSQRILKSVADTGQLDYLNISVGNYQSQATIIAPMYVPLGSFVYAAAGIKEVVDIPVFCVGRINDPLQAEQIIAGGYADVVCMNRAIIADPDFANKAASGRADEIRKCIGCNEACWGGIMGYMGLSGGIGCTINPDIGFEHDMVLQPAARRKRVMVVGGGIAGLEAARVAAERGHEVAIYDRAAELGGQLPTAAKAPLRVDFGDPVRYYQSQIRRLGIDVHLGVEVTDGLVTEVAPDALVVATGSTPRALEGIPGLEGADVTEVRAVLDERAAPGRRVLVLADEHHQEALSTAEFLLARGHEVTVVSKRHAAGREVEYITSEMLTQRLVELGVEFIPLTWATRVDGTAVTLASLLTGEERVVEADTIVFAGGGTSQRGLADALDGRVPEIHVIGDAVAPRRILYATRDGNRVGKAI